MAANKLITLTWRKLCVKCGRAHDKNGNSVGNLSASLIIALRSTDNSGEFDDWKHSLKDLRAHVAYLLGVDYLRAPFHLARYANGEEVTAYVCSGCYPSVRQNRLVLMSTSRVLFDYTQLDEWYELPPTWVEKFRLTSFVRTGFVNTPSHGVKFVDEMALPFIDKAGMDAIRIALGLTLVGSDEIAPNRG